MNGRKATLCIRYTTKDADESRNCTVNRQVWQALGMKSRGIHRPWDKGHYPSPHRSPKTLDESKMIQYWHLSDTILAKVLGSY